MEIDWLIYFPKDGNKGKYWHYTVTHIVRKKDAFQPEKSVTLGEVLESPEFEERYPHTVGFFKEASGESPDFKPQYLEIRKIGTIEEFWMFLNALDI